MATLHFVVLSFVFSLVPACFSEEVADTFSDDGVSLLQMSKRQQHTDAGHQVIVPPSSTALRFVGRHDIVRHGGEEVVRFDAAGFEVQFRVQGAREVRVNISQEITGPGGWYAMDNPTPENVFEDACLYSKKKTIGLSEGLVDGRLGLGMLSMGSEPHHFLVYLDGVAQWKPLMKSRCRVCTFDTTEAVRGNSNYYTIATGLDPSKSYHIRMVKTSEPDFSSDPAPVPNWLSLHSVILDQGYLQRPDPARKRKIEFVGDSMMSGYCNICAGTPCENGRNYGQNLGGEPPDTSRWGSYALAWPHIVCEELKAECHATVLSGMGIHCNTHPPGDPDDCSADQTLPQYWQRTLASDKATAWDYNTWIPDAFVFQASGNEHYDDPVRSKTAILATYDEFIDTVQQKYPAAHIFLVCGPFHQWWLLDENNLCPAMERLVYKKKHSGIQIDMIDFSKYPEQHQNVTDCCGHPGIDFHKLIKAKMAEEVQRIMGWNDL